MGKKGAKLTTDAEQSAQDFVGLLDGIDGVAARKMFGGLGIFHEKTMFGIVDSAGAVFLRAADANQHRFDEAGSSRHGKMPYYSIPDAVLKDTAELHEWAEASIAVANAAKKK